MRRLPTSRDINQFRARQKRHTNDDTDDDDRGPKIGLEQQQRGNNGENGNKLCQPAPMMPNRLFLSDQVARGVEQHRQLGEFRWLKRYDPQRQPALRAINLAANTRESSPK